MRNLATAVLVCLPVHSLTAQAVRGGDLVVTDFAAPGSVFRVDTAGNVQTLHSGAPLAGPAGIAVARNRDVLVTDFNTNSLLRIDAQTGAIAPVAGGLGGPLRVVEMLDGDFAVTSSSGRSVLRVTPGGVVSTIAGGAPMNRPFSVAVDMNGDLLVADDLGRAVWRVTPAGAVSPIATGGALRLPQGVALFPNGDYAVIDGVVDAVFRIDRASGLLTTWVAAGTLGVNPEGIVTDWSGGFAVVHSGNPGGPGVRVIDAAGAANALPVVSPTWSNLEDVALVPHVAGPRTLATGPGAQFTFSLDAPAAGGDFYSLILSASTFPGWTLPGGAPRALFINLDPFFLATIGQNAPPALVGWSSFLSAAGSATASLDLTALPAGVLAGLVLYQQGITLTGRSVNLATNVLRLSF
jgi:hypothetical protein